MDILGTNDDKVLVEEDLGYRSTPYQFDPTQPFAIDPSV